MKHHNIIMLMFIQLIFTISPGSSVGLNIFSSSPIGLYQLIVKQVYNCNPTQTNKIRINLYVHQRSNLTFLLGNATFEIPLDDTFFFEMKMALKESSGNWKENVIIQKWSRACTTLKKIFGNEWTTFMHSSGIQHTECPILSGTYIAPGIDTSIFMKTNFPKTFFYGTYKVHAYYSRRNEIFGCQVFILELKRR